MTPLRTSLESMPTFSSSRHSLSNFSGVSLFSMLQREREREQSQPRTQLHSKSHKRKHKHKPHAMTFWTDSPSDFPEDGVVTFFLSTRAAISFSASGRNPFLVARTWGLPQELAVEHRQEPIREVPHTAHAPLLYHHLHCYCHWVQHLTGLTCLNWGYKHEGNP